MSAAVPETPPAMRPSTSSWICFSFIMGRYRDPTRPSFSCQPKKTCATFFVVTKKILSETVTVRIPQDLLVLLDRRVESLNKRPETSASRADCIRFALESYLNEGKRVRT
jgi:hypothetical protein